MTTQRVKGHGAKNAKFMAIGMAPEKTEVALGRPFMGRSGQLYTDALRLNGLSREIVYTTNISEEFLPSGGSLFSISPQKLQLELLRLRREIEDINPNVIFAMGDEPVQILTGKKGITKWAGSILPCTLLPEKKIVASIHPAWILRGMWKWLSVFQHVYVKRAVEQSRFPSLQLKQRHSIIKPAFSTVVDYIHIGLENPEKILTFDIETLWWRRDSPGFIGCIGLGYADSEALCIPFCYRDGKSFWPSSQENYIWKLLTKLLQSPIRKVAQNASFEWTYFWLHSIFPRNLYVDTMLLHHLLYPDFGGVDDEFRKKNTGEPGHGLAFLCSVYTDHPYYKDDGKILDSKSKVDIEEWWTYNCKDVMITHEVMERLVEEALEKDLLDFYKQQYIDTFYHALREEWDGIEINMEERGRQEQAFLEKEKLLQDTINKMVGYELQVNSRNQMKKFLFTEKGYKPIFSRKPNKKGVKIVTVDKTTFEKLSIMNPQDEVLKHIVELKKVKDYLADILRQPVDVNNRIHTHYKLGGTDGARWSSTRSILGNGTNFQNIPREGLARRLFLP